MVGDKVQIKADDSGLFYVGHIMSIRHTYTGDVTYDVKMLGVDNDIEVGVVESAMRKLLSYRLLQVNKRSLKRTMIKIKVVRAFAGLAHTSHN